MEKRFIITPKTERSVTITVRISSDINQKLEEAAAQSGRSRNELINMALRFAFDNMEVAPNPES